MKPILRIPTDASRLGRIRIAPWALTAVAIVTSFSLARWYQRALPARQGQDTATTPEDRAKLFEKGLRTLSGWEGSHAFADGQRLEALLVPYVAEGRDESYRSERIRERFHLPTGGLYRLHLALAGGEPDLQPEKGEPLVVHGASVGQAGRLSDLLTVTGDVEVARGDPLHLLLAGLPIELSAGRSRQVALWGERPLGSTTLRLLVNEEPLELELTVIEIGEQRLPRWFSRVAQVEETAHDLEIEALSQRVLELEDDLRAAKHEHLAFVQSMAEFKSSEWLAPPEPEAPEPEAEPTRAELENERRTEEIATSLKALLRVTGTYGLDLFSAGRVHAADQEQPGYLGPVLFRVLDARGNLTGTLAAERLRLEAARAARSLTIVLEDGFESYDGTRVPFAAGVRRIPLGVDPEDMLARTPELFSEGDLNPPEDDGLWVHSEVRNKINALLGEDADLGWWRVHSFGGIQDGEFVAVHLEEMDRDGRLVRRLFADRMKVQMRELELVLVLLNGVSLRGETRAAFRDGRHVIHLVRADLERWRQAQLPGLFDPVADTPERDIEETAGADR